MRYTPKYSDSPHSLWKQYLMVKEFHRKFGQPIGDNEIAGISEERFNLRVMLIEEELKELFEFTDEQNLMKESVDVIYVILGTFIEYSAPWWADEEYMKLAFSQIIQFSSIRKGMYVFKEVGSLSALHGIIVDVLCNLRHHGLLGHFNESFKEVHRSNMSKVWDDGTVHYNDSGKVIKPPTYSKADLSFIGK